MEGFAYVVNPPEPGRVAFGSGLERETFPLSGPSLTPFMRRHQGNKLDGPGPWNYEVHKIEKKIPGSNRGHYAFASSLKRLPDIKRSTYPSFGAYNVHLDKPVKPAIRPFGSTEERPPFHPPPIPGPPTYQNEPLPRYRENAAFGSKREIWPAVAVICAPNHTAKCVKCNRTPYGDYFRNFCNQTDMCRPCMHKENDALRDCEFDLFDRKRIRGELNLYRRVRYCGFYHDHQGTKAATQIISNKTLNTKIRKENYLYQYMK